MNKQCTECGNELNKDSHFCNYCGIAVNSKKVKRKNGFAQLSEKARQARILGILTFVLILGVAGFYGLRSARPAVLDGTWVGTVQSDNGNRYQYELVITQNGTEVTGTAITRGAGAGGTTNMVGSYENGVLVIQETSNGDSRSYICYWEVELELGGTSANPSLSGNYEGIGCGSEGEMTLYREE